MGTEWLVEQSFRFRIEGRLLLVRFVRMEWIKDSNEEGKEEVGWRGRDRGKGISEESVKLGEGKETIGKIGKSENYSCTSTRTRHQEPT